AGSWQRSLLSTVDGQRLHRLRPFCAGLHRRTQGCLAGRNLRLVPIAVIGICDCWRGRTGDFAANDDTLGGDRSWGSLRLSPIDDFQDGGVGLVVFERAGVAFDVVAQRDELADHFFIVELNALRLELPGNLMYALLRHTLKPSTLLTMEQYLPRERKFQARYIHRVRLSPECPMNGPVLRRRRQAPRTAYVSSPSPAPSSPIHGRLAGSCNHQSDELPLGPTAATTDAGPQRGASFDSNLNVTCRHGFVLGTPCSSRRPTAWLLRPPVRQSSASRW